MSFEDLPEPQIPQDQDPRDPQDSRNPQSPEPSHHIDGPGEPGREVSRESRILDRTRELGFELAGIADVRPSDHMEFYAGWLQEGHHGSMGYLARDDARSRRADLRTTLESVRSAVVVAHEYFVPDPPGVPEDPERAVIARYARGRDYHRVIEEKLQDLLEWIREEVGGSRFGGMASVEGDDFVPDGGRSAVEGGSPHQDGARSVEGRVYVDTGPILERELAQRAGLGWFGKNTMLLNPRKGSYFFLGVLLLDMDLESTGPFTEDRCGTCSRCLEACPTDALLGRDETGAPVMNARRCISYLTIEHRGPIPRELRPLMGNRVYGCDICQEVCPFNHKFAEETDEDAYTPKPEFDGPTLIELAEHLLPMSENEFLRVYEDSPISRARRKGLLRNVCIGLGNWLARERAVREERSGRAMDGAVDPPPEAVEEAVAQTMAEAVEVLIRALNDDRPLVRGHAAWALGEATRGVERDVDGFDPGRHGDHGRRSVPPGRSISAETSAALRARLEVEEDDWVREECEVALSGSG